MLFDPRVARRPPPTRSSKTIRNIFIMISLFLSLLHYFIIIALISSLSHYLAAETLIIIALFLRPTCLHTFLFSGLQSVWRRADTSERANVLSKLIVGAERVPVKHRLCRRLCLTQSVLILRKLIPTQISRLILFMTICQG